MKPTNYIPVGSANTLYEQPVGVRHQHSNIINENYNMWDYTAKIIMIGDTNTGKTSTLYSLQNYKLDTTPSSTIGVEFAAILYKHAAKIFKFQIWDTAGQEKFHSITKSFFKNSTIAMLFCDLTNYKTFRSLPSWLYDLSRHAPEDVIIILVGNKSDLHEQRQVSYDEIVEFAQMNSLPYCETAAILGSGVDTILETMCTILYEKIKTSGVKNIKGMREKHLVEVKTGNSKLCDSCHIM